MNVIRETFVMASPMHRPHFSEDVTIRRDRGSGTNPRVGAPIGTADFSIALHGLAWANRQNLFKNHVLMVFTKKFV